ncbi:MAG: hypothetical protein P1U89_13640 [Verrucomicrobiales bacterium]|nr:hypothetical protein [Verrucomicrobiales bacterium]
MAIEEIEMTFDNGPVDRKVESLVAEATRQQDEFYGEGLGLRYPKYVPSDPRVVCRAIKFLKEGGHLQGDVFCEWGCGFAVASGIASLLGMKSYGIEIEDELYDRATRLMEHLELPVEIIQSDYLPYGFDEIEEIGGKELVITRHQSIAPEYGDLNPEDVDLFFVYPWPDQEEMMIDLFSAVSEKGAVLLMYQGEGEISAFLND